MSSPVFIPQSVEREAKEKNARTKIRDEARRGGAKKIGTTGKAFDLSRPR